jgi:hypothetical protein
MKLTQSQIETITRLKTEDELYYLETYNSNPNYTDFLERTFGEEYNELHDEWQRCYDFEFDMDWYVYQVTNKLSKAMKSWIEEGKELQKDLV